MIILDCAEGECIHPPPISNYLQHCSCIQPSLGVASIHFLVWTFLSASLKNSQPLRRTMYQSDFVPSHIRKPTHQYSHGNENPRWSLLKCRIASRLCRYSRRFSTGHRRQQYFFSPGITSFVSSNISHILLAPLHAWNTPLVLVGAISALTVTPSAKIM